MNCPRRSRNNTNHNRNCDVMHRLSVVLCCLVLSFYTAQVLSGFCATELRELFSPQASRIITYKAASGDTLWSIAAEFTAHSEDVRDKVIAIRKLNGLSPNQVLQPGQTIQVPLTGVQDRDFRYTYKTPEAP